MCIARIALRNDYRFLRKAYLKSVIKPTLTDGHLTFFWNIIVFKYSLFLVISWPSSGRLIANVQQISWRISYWSLPVDWCTCASKAQYPSTASVRSAMTFESRVLTADGMHASALAQQLAPPLCSRHPWAKFPPITKALLTDSASFVCFLFQRSYLKIYDRSVYRWWNFTSINVWYIYIS